MNRHPEVLEVSAAGRPLWDNSDASEVRVVQLNARGGESPFFLPRIRLPYQWGVGDAGGNTGQSGSYSFERKRLKRRFHFSAGAGRADCTAALRVIGSVTEGRSYLENTPPYQDKD